MNENQAQVKGNGAMDNKDCSCYYREYTKEEQLNIRCGDAYDDDGDDEISDSIIARGKLVPCQSCRVRVVPRAVPTLQP